MPETARELVARVRELAAAKEQELEAERQALSDQKARFAAIIENLEDGDTSKALEQYQALEQVHTRTEGVLADTIFMAFSARNPKYDALPAEVRTAFADLVQANRHAAMFPDDNPVEQLEKGLRYVCFEKGVQVDATRGPATPHPVADGTGSTRSPMVPLSEKSLDDILHAPEAVRALDEHFTGRA